MLLELALYISSLQGDATKITLFGQASYYKQPAKEKKATVTIRAKTVREGSHAKRTVRHTKQVAKVQEQVDNIVKVAKVKKIEKKTLRRLVVTYKFVREGDNQPIPIEGASYEAVQYGSKGRVTQQKNLTVNSSGVATVDSLKTEPGAITLKLPEEIVAQESDDGGGNAEWEPTSDQSLVTAIPLLYSTNAKDVATHKITQTITLRRQVADFELDDVPADAKLDFGDIDIPLKRDGSKVFFQVERDALADGVEVTLSTGSPAPKQAILSLPTSADPYRTNNLTIEQKAWQLTGLPDLIVLSLDTKSYFERVKTGFRPSYYHDLWPFTVESFLRPSAFSLPQTGGTSNEDGSVNFERSGVTFKTRTIIAKDPLRPSEESKPLQIIERIDIASPEGGAVGGIKVGDPMTKVEQVLGPPGQKGLDGEYEYLKGVSITPRDGKVEKMSITAPIPMVAEGYEPASVKIPDRVFVECRNNVDTPSGSGTTGLDNIFGRSPEQELAELDGSIRRKLQNIGGLPQVEREADANLIIRWTLNSVTLDRINHVARMRGFLTIEKPAETAQGKPEILVERTLSCSAEGEMKILGAGETIDAMALRRCREKVYADLISLLRESLDVRVRVKSVDSNYIILDAGSDSGIHAGDEFEIENVGELVWLPSMGEPYKSKTKDPVVAVVARAVKVSSDQTLCEIGLLVRGKGEVGQGPHEVVAEVDIPKRKAMAKELSKWIADPRTGTVTAKFRVKNAPPGKKS